MLSNWERRHEMLGGLTPRSIICEKCNSGMSSVAFTFDSLMNYCNCMICERCIEGKYFRVSDDVLDILKRDRKINKILNI